MSLTATRRVFGTVELLEMILYEIAIQELLAASLVCRHWHATMVDSVKLCRAQWLSAATHSRDLSQGLPITEVEPPSPTTFYLNAVLGNIAEHCVIRCKNICFELPPSSKPLKIRAGSTYCDMLAVQPPLASVVVDLEALPGDIVFEFQDDDSNGIRVGRVLDAIMEVHRHAEKNWK